MQRLCSVDACKCKHHGNGLCKKHYEKRRRTGTLRPIHHGTRVFVDEAIASDSDDCIIWPYRLNAGGYGVVTHEGRQMPVHRVVLIKTKGCPPSPTHVAAHAPVICHDRRCINPNHLRWATRAENEADKSLDGTRQYGEQNGHSKLTSTQAQAIRKDGRKLSQIAEEYGISQSAVSMIKAGKRWKKTEYFAETI